MPRPYEVKLTPQYVHCYLRDLGYTEHEADVMHMELYRKALPLVHTEYDKKLDTLRDAAGRN